MIANASKTRVIVPALSAPELSVLLREGRGDGREALRLAVLELVACGALRLDAEGTRRRRLGITRTGLDVALVPPLAEVLDEIGGLSIDMRTLEQQLSTKWDSARDYVLSVVVPALAGRGLVRTVSRRWLSFLGPKLELTAAGRRVREDVEDRVGVLEGTLAAWARDDPSQALRYLAESGATILLAREAWPEIRRLWSSAPPALPIGASGIGKQAALASMSVLGPTLDFSFLRDLDQGGLDGWAGGDFGGGDGGGDGGGGGGN